MWLIPLIWTRGDRSCVSYSAGLVRVLFSSRSHRPFFLFDTVTYISFLEQISYFAISYNEVICHQVAVMSPLKIILAISRRILISFPSRTIARRLRQKFDHEWASKATRSKNSKKGKERKVNPRQLFKTCEMKPKISSLPLFSLSR